MKLKLFLSTLLCVFTLTAALSAAPSEDDNCPCGDGCDCTVEKHCGCMN